MLLTSKPSNIRRMMACALAGIGLSASATSTVFADNADLTSEATSFFLNQATSKKSDIILDSGSIDTATPRIVGGSNVTDLRYPWMAALYFRRGGGNSFSQGCGGSVIADSWILTAAHCVINNGQTTDADNLALVLGAPNLNSNNRTVRFVSRVIPHPDYNPGNNRNDMALLQLEESVDFEPIALPNTAASVPNDGESATVAGWGATSEDGPGTTQLQETDLPIVSTNNCRALYGNLINGPTMVCAGGGQQDACFGDSGGPLFVPRGNQFVQAGVVSFGFGCARPGLPAVYARTSTQFDWINSVVGGSLQAFGGTTIAEDISTDQTTGDTVVHITKRNAPGFALESNNGGTSGQNVFLWSSNPNDVNQQWVEIDRGNGFYSYQKNGTNVCIDGGNDGARRQNVFLFTCASGNFNQSWQKESVGGGAFKLIKRNAPDYTIDGNSGGSRGQNVQLWSSANTSENLQWIISPQ